MLKDIYIYNNLTNNTNLAQMFRFNILLPLLFVSKFNPQLHKWGELIINDFLIIWIFKKIPSINVESIKKKMKKKNPLPTLHFSYKISFI